MNGKARYAVLAVAVLACAALLLGFGRSSQASGGQVTFDGFQWEPLGQAVLTVDASGLKVTNIGTSGSDGVRQIVPPGFVPGTPNPFHRYVEHGIQVPGSPDGAFFKTASYGTLNGVPGQMFSSATISVQNGKARRESNLTPLAPSSLTVEYLLKGVTVDTETGVPVSFYVEDPKTPDSCDEAGNFDWKFSVDVQKHGGGTATADFVKVVPVGSTATVGALSSVDWTAAHTSEFVIKALP